jgi:hypothetical protein
MKSETKFALSARGLANIPETELTNDCEFVVGDSHYHCPSLIADFLSPLLCRLRLIDQTINNFLISTKDDLSQFGDFLKLGCGFPLSITDSNREFLASICADLENRELQKFLFVSSGGDLSCSNVAARMNFLEGICCDLSAVIGFAASHFFEISSSDLSSLSHSTFMEVIAHLDLKLSTGDSVFDTRNVFRLIRASSTSFNSFDSSSSPPRILGNSSTWFVFFSIASRFRTGYRSVLAFSFPSFPFSLVRTDAVRSRLGSFRIAPLRSTESFRI